MMQEPFIVLILSWLVPGSGHFLLGKAWRGVAFFLIITVTFAIGCLLTRGYAVQGEHVLASVAQAPAGLPYLVGLGFEQARGDAAMPREVVGWIDLGLVFTMLAGLLNMLLSVDAFDRAGGNEKYPWVLPTVFGVAMLARQAMRQGAFR